MSMTLGLNTALSGLMTAQRGLDTISQNVTNVNTKGYTRKVMNPESVVLNGTGAGVQAGKVTRMVSEGLLKDIRRQQTTTGSLEVQQDYYPRLDDLFGQVTDSTSVAHRVNDLTTAFQTLASEVNKPSTQWSTMQSAQDVAAQLNSMSSSVQNMRVEADRTVADTVGQINTLLDNIFDLNQKIVKNGAIATGTADLEDKRDTALTDLSKLVDIQYYKRNDGGVTIYTNSGEMLLDNKAQHLSYSAANSTDTWMTAAGGQFNPITLEGGSQNLGPEIQGGKLRALLDMRDSTLTNMQANLDTLAAKMRDTVNQVHNRGTSQPNMASYYEGTRVFAKQDSPVANPAEVNATLYAGGVALPPAAYTSLALAPNGAKPWQMDVTATAGVFNVTDFAAGKTFTIDNATDPANNGSYRVVSYTSTSQVTVEKVNPRQTMQLQNSDDVVIATFDNNGDQVKQTTLRTIMGNDYTAYGTVTPGTGRTVDDFGPQAGTTWSVSEVSAHVEAWLNSQGYTAASVNLNSEGKMVVNLGSTTNSLAFRDQSSSTAGGTTTDATINFDVNGDGAVDQQVKGFSNFFGLNDLYTNNKSFLMDSAVQSASYTTGQTRDISLYDESGKVGNTITVPRGSSLQQIADQINAQTRTNDSVVLSNTSWTLTTPATITVTDASGTVNSPVTLAAGVPHSLNEIAGLLNQGTLNATVVQDGPGTRLRLTDSRGVELQVSIAGGSVAGSTLSLGQTLDMTAAQRIQASVIPEGSGYRLRVRQTTGEAVYASSALDAKQTNLISDLGLAQADTGAAASLSVRSDIMTNPAKLSRGSMQYNSDTGQYYLSEGDNTTALQLGDAMNAKQDIAASGSISSGKYTLAEYGAAAIGVVAQASSNSKDQMAYQTTLNQSLNFQNSSYSGVNMDEEISAMMDYQQAYSAAAKVITVMQDMLQTLTQMIR